MSCGRRSGELEMGSVQLWEGVNELWEGVRGARDGFNAVVGGGQGS